MNLLGAELDRLYRVASRHGEGSDSPNSEASASDPGALMGHSTSVRALVLEVGGPAEWKTIAPVWQGVQADLGFAAPAIAVNGKDAFQVWFSLTDALPAQQALRLLRGLQQRYLPEIKPARIRLFPSLAQTDGSPEWRHATPPPSLMPDTGRWSAFLAPDLASIFSDEPWLDREPDAQAQANLLAHLNSIPPSVVEAALAQLAPPLTPLAAEIPSSAPVLALAPIPAATLQECSPRNFLLQVMNDPGVAMHLRIEAAKALLAHDAK